MSYYPIGRSCFLSLPLGKSYICNLLVLVIHTKYPVFYGGGDMRYHIHVIHIFVLYLTKKYIYIYIYLSFQIHKEIYTLMSTIGIFNLVCVEVTWIQKLDLTFMIRFLLKIFFGSSQVQHPWESLKSLSPAFTYLCVCSRAAQVW